MVQKFFYILLILVLVAPAAAGPFDTWNDGQLTVSFTGRGLESGQILDLAVSNESKVKKEFQLPQLMILEPVNSKYAPVVVESKGAWELKPGANFKARVSGYSLDNSKKMPSAGQPLKYRPSQGGKRYKKAQYALKKSLQVEKRPGFKAMVLPADKHRALVIQRVIWRSFGGKNPKTPNALVEDLTLAFKRAGKPASEKAVQAIAGSIWRDVEKVYIKL